MVSRGAERRRRDDKRNVPRVAQKLQQASHRGRRSVGRGRAARGCVFFPQRQQHLPQPVGPVAYLDELSVILAGRGQRALINRRLQPQATLVGGKSFSKAW